MSFSPSYVQSIPQLYSQIKQPIISFSEYFHTRRGLYSLTQVLINKVDNYECQILHEIFIA